MSATQLPNAPHGVNAFGDHQSCRCQACENYRSAVTRLVDSFSMISADWIRELCENRGLSLPLPMWGTLFLPRFDADVRAITRLAICPDVVDDLEQDALIVAGWMQIPNCGVWTAEFDDHLLLGIDGAGYDFFAQHWSKLYDALGYHWHLS